MFDDVDAFIQQTTSEHRKVCRFTAWVRTLDEDDQGTAERLVQNTTYNCRDLVRYFATKGLNVGDQTLRRHRAGACCGQRP